VLSGGTVIDTGVGETAAAIQEFNDRAVRDDRVDLVMLPLADGVTVAVRR
jgi:caffeoyl-CoA O-methyltransferase